MFEGGEPEPILVCSNYKRLHHFHERISQLMLQESVIPKEHFESITHKLREYPVINKSSVRAVLRSLKMQKYIEKWLQIAWRVTKCKPPELPNCLNMKLDDLFIRIQAPFEKFKPDKRKNFLNYNYTFHRFFQMLQCPQFSMFFPLIKSKQKRVILDEVWRKICEELCWRYTPLLPVKEFEILNPLYVPQFGLGVPGGLHLSATAVTAET